MQNELVTKIHNPALELRVRDLLLNALTVSSGAVDAISFLALGKVFSAFMTGNIAFLGLRVAGADAPGVVAIVVSMVAFAVGVYLSTRIVKPSEGSGMWPGRVTAALGLSLIAHVVFLAVWFATNGQPSIDVAHVLLGSWGLAMGMQSAAVRTLHVEGVFYNGCDSNHHIACGRHHQLVRHNRREAPACRRARLFVRRRHSRRPASG